MLLGIDDAEKILLTGMFCLETLRFAQLRATVAVIRIAREIRKRYATAVRS